MSQRNNDMQQSRTLLIASGILFLLVGSAAMALPVLFTALIMRFLAVFILVSGVISMVMVLIGKHKIPELFFGINLVFKGAAQLALGIAPRTGSAAAA